MAIRFRLLRDKIDVQLMFAEPILEWAGIHGRFFRMVYTALRDKLPINSGDFSAAQTMNLGEWRATYSLFGGPTSVTLFTDRLAFDFPNLLPTDYPMALDVMGTLHDALPHAFPELNYDRVELQSYKHLDLGWSDTVAGFLERFRLPNLETFFPSAVQQPSCKLGLQPARLEVIDRHGRCAS